MTWGIEMLYFLAVPYELIVAATLIIWLEYYYLVKKKVEIKNKDLRKGLSGVIVFFLLFYSKLFIFYLG